MRKLTTRRNVLRGGAGLTAFGAAGYGTVFGASRLGRQASDTAKAGNAAGAVVRKVDKANGTVQLEGKVSGWFRAEGFPEGWPLAVGDRVTVAPSAEASGVAAFPHTHWITFTGSPADLAPGVRLGGPDGPEMVAATILDPTLLIQRDAGRGAVIPLKAAVADTASPAGRQRVFSVRQG
jgi:hypothetical protein